MKLVASVLAAGLIACCNPALADDIDLSTWTCKQFQSADDETIKLVLTWPPNPVTGAPIRDEVGAHRSRGRNPHVAELRISTDYLLIRSGFRQSDVHRPHRSEHHTQRLRHEYADAER